MSTRHDISRRALLGLGLALGTGCSRPRAAALRVFAASSLREALSELGARFEQASPGVRVRPSFAGSQELSFQLEHGARADVVVCADPRSMNALLAAGHVLPAVVLALNELVIVAPKGSALRELGLLPEARRIVLGAPEVPAGRYALEMLDKASMALGRDFRARVEARVASREPNVRQVLAKVALGEADAGIVYLSDAERAQANVERVEIPKELNVVAEYPVAQHSRAKEPARAAAFLAWLASDDARSTLVRHGFRLPERRAE